MSKTEQRILDHCKKWGLFVSTYGHEIGRTGRSWGKREANAIFKLEKAGLVNVDRFPKRTSFERFTVLAVRLISPESDPNVID